MMQSPIQVDFSRVRLYAPVLMFLHTTFAPSLLQGRYLKQLSECHFVGTDRSVYTCGRNGEVLTSKMKSWQQMENCIFLGLCNMYKDGVVSQRNGWVWYLHNFITQHVAIRDFSEVTASGGGSTKPHLLHKECLGKVAPIAGTFSSERVQSLTLKYCTYYIYITCVSVSSFAEMNVADKDFKKRGELRLVRRCSVQ